VPERAFDTARSVEVVTSEDLWRKNGLTLADVLADLPGVSVQQSTYYGGVPSIRGLNGKQVQILIDGVRLNNATWGGYETNVLNMIDVSMIERIEIVRGVVSVFGSESLGGVINIITRKSSSDALTGTVGLRYSSADSGFSTPLFFSGGSAKFRYAVGMSYTHSGDVNAPSLSQPRTGFAQQMGRTSLQYLVSQDKTLSLSYNDVKLRDGSFPADFSAGRISAFDLGSLREQLGSVSYQDLTSRKWLDSFRVNAYMNRHSDSGSAVTAFQPLTQTFKDRVDVKGLSVELGTFLGGNHHFVYGVDYIDESVRGDAILITASGLQVPGRLKLPPSVGYQTSGVYLNDHFHITKYFTASAGLRYGSYRASGQENLLAHDRSGAVVNTFHFNYDNSDAALTSSASLTYNATDSLHFMANYVNGFRAPNVDDVAGVAFDPKQRQVTVPNTAAEPERVASYELGAKFSGTRASASAFWYHNDFSDLLVTAPGKLNGLPFLDINGNGRQELQLGELGVLQRLNVGHGRISGIELEGSVQPAAGLTLFGSYTTAKGDVTIASSEAPMSYVTPAFGNAGARYASGFRNAWVEANVRFADAQKRLGYGDLITPWTAAGTPAYRVLNVRTGLDALYGMRLTAGVNNVTNETYRTHGSFVFQPKRELVLGTQFKF
ncbi:MAG TPA: TonB-dependent receptor, partial [Thermoanaerobaculia bacterium]|nr:TonB-dependent receptor [Thermoanaerobaculia bacterium]